MREGDPQDLTREIAAARAGDEAARAELFSALYGELKRIAARTPHVGRPGDTMQPTVLANETFLELTRRFPPPPRSIPESRATFFRTVALAMRTILRDHWRGKLAAKRGGGARGVALDEAHVGAADREALEFLALDEALDRLERYNARWHHVVLHRYFAGRTISETAEMVGVAESTVSSDWQLARAWLRDEMKGIEPWESDAPDCPRSSSD